MKQEGKIPYRNHFINISVYKMEKENYTKAQKEESQSLRRGFLVDLHLRTVRLSSSRKRDFQRHKDRNNFIRIIDHNALPSTQNLEELTYCTWHNSSDHNTSNCNVFH
jgi:hypothetical protein